MNKTLIKLYAFYNSIDRRYIQIAYMVFMLGMVLLRAPEDGGSGTR
jgi:hypothetical protein